MKCPFVSHSQLIGIFGGFKVSRIVFSSDSHPLTRLFSIEVAHKIYITNSLHTLSSTYRKSFPIMAPNNSLCASRHSMDMNLSQHYSSAGKYTPLIPPALSEEEAILAVSCDTISSNIIADALSGDFKAAVTTQISSGETYDGCEGYWDMPNEEEEVDTLSSRYMKEKVLGDVNIDSNPSQQTYWDWPENDAIIQSELKKHILQNVAQHELMRAAENNDIESSTTADFDYENIDSDDYFYFPSHTPAKRVDKNIVRMGSSTLKETVNYWDW